VNPPERADQPRFDEPPAQAERGSALASLNPAQYEAVTHPGGSLLVLAGAGSGKTRVITHRIAHLILDVGVSASRIVAVTFTNKAANEMRERVQRHLGTERLGAWIGTFHALCLRLLRREAARIGIDPRFVVYDTDDQLAIVKRVLKQECPDEDRTARFFLSRISRAKNALESPDELEHRAFSPERKVVARIYRGYVDALAEANALDFDDLLLRTLELFDRDEEARSHYSERCEHLLVDEYQDTNRPQYKLVRHLCSHHGNVCVVGDEDQSIYRFRGAEIRNILDFERDHPDTRTIRLEQNYRSTAAIIEAAGALIANNRYRKGKTLWTDNVRGDKLELFRAPDDRHEAAWVTQKVKLLSTDDAYEDMAVLYRTNAQSRQLEEILRRDRIPYQIVGSVQFYERKEIKDLLGYLKLLVNPADSVSFRRVVNTPPRGIGDTTMRIVDSVARDLGLPLATAAQQALEQQLISNRSAGKLARFLDFIDELRLKADDGSPVELLERIVDEVDFEAHLNKIYAGLGSERMENVKALISAAVEYAEEAEEPTLRGFLDRSALVADADEVGQRPGVTLMTIHCAKGLEFPVVFLVGLEENLFPHAMASGTDEDLEEERRLCYVAMTRAQRRLFLSHARCRRLQGTLVPNPPSRFIDEIPRELLDESGSTAAGFFDDWRVRDGSRSTGSSAARAARRPAPAPPPKPIRPGVDPGDGFPVGAFVLHPSFGGGQILNREGSGKLLKLTIHFSDHGPKKILPAYTKLRVRTG
jgi:DNA helicase-2/ATP-dependent DNA helicase PcrA